MLLVSAARSRSKNFPVFSDMVVSLIMYKAEYEIHLVQAENQKITLADNGLSHAFSRIFQKCVHFMQIRWEMHAFYAN